MEFWDAYDESRKPLGYTVQRDKFYSYNSEYHIVVHIWIKNSKGDFLIQKRSANKKSGLKWAGRLALFSQMKAVLTAQ